jgi:hypothetical protein
MVDWLSVRADPIEAVEHGVEAESDLFRSMHTGPRSFDRIDYPLAEVLPEETNRLDATNWSHAVRVNLYFERGRDLDYVEDVLHPVAGVLDSVLTSLGDTECTNNYYPETIEDYAGELDNTKLLLVSIRFRVTTLVDPGTF